MMVDGILCHEKPSKGLVSRMRQLRGGGENQEDEEMKILNTLAKKTTIKNIHTIIYSKLYLFFFFFLGQLGLINRGRFLPRKKILG